MIGNCFGIFEIGTAFFCRVVYYGICVVHGVDFVGVGRYGQDNSVEWSEYWCHQTYLAGCICRTNSGYRLKVSNCVYIINRQMYSAAKIQAKGYHRKGDQL